MSLKEKFEAGLLKSDQNLVRSRPPSNLYNQFNVERLKQISRIALSLDDLYNIGQPVIESQRKVFKISHDANVLGKIIKIQHTIKPREIQFAVPFSDNDALYVDIREDNVLGSKTYNYTGKVDEAVNRLVEWLAEVAPEHAEKISAILDKIENPPRGPVMVCQSSGTADTGGPRIVGH